MYIHDVSVYMCVADFRKSKKRILIKRKIQNLRFFRHQSENENRIKLMISELSVIQRK